MEITFFIGNGFDLSKKLKTRYIDFYDYITGENGKNNSLKEGNFFLKEIKKFMEKDNSIDIKEGEPNNINWSDFEQALGAYTKNLQDLTDGEKYLDDLIDFRDAFIAYIKGEESKFEINKEDAKLMFQNLSLNFYKGIKKHEENIINDFLKGTTYPNYNFNFINFNYTNTLSKIIKQIDKIDDSSSGKYMAKTPIHVHRTLDYGTYLGVNDVSQIANPDIFDEDDIGDIIKPVMQSYDDTTIVDGINDLIESTNIFVIYGMSMGVTDKIWWRKIAEQVMNHRKYLIINRYTTDAEKESANKHPRISRKLRNSVLNEFMQNLELEDNKKSELLKRTFVILGSENIFELKEKDS